MRRWIVDLGGVALLAAGAGIFIVFNVGWPNTGPPNFRRQLA
jgi:hypothetical protein